MFNVRVTTPLATFTSDCETFEDAVQIRENIRNRHPEMWVDHHHEPDSDLNADVVHLASGQIDGWIIVSIEEEN